ncbi:hypothetical protein QUF72_18370 [Desulfobacterales bacterium HSG2]|nr:hypothetical protein [Desulfobacterales bacterium HSG2]
MLIRLVILIHLADDQDAVIPGAVRVIIQGKLRAVIRVAVSLILYN